MGPLTLLRSLSLSIRLDGDKLMVSPMDRIDEHVRDYIALYRPEILRELVAEEMKKVDDMFQET